MPDRENATDGGLPPNLEPDSQQIRPLTVQLILSSLFDTWPGNAAVMDFGIDSDRHLGALHHAIRYAEVTAEELDAAMGNGEKLTEIAQRGNNPYRDVSFRTAWDDMPRGTEDEPPAATTKDPAPIDPETDSAVTELEKSWQPAPELRGYVGTARLDNLELTEEENERYLDEIAESYGLSREQMDDYYERLAGGDEPESNQPAPERPSYDDFLNEATERAASRMQGKDRDR